MQISTSKISVTLFHEIKIRTEITEKYFFIIYFEMEMLQGLPLSENEVEIISKVMNSESAPLEALVMTVAATMIDLAKKEVYLLFWNVFEKLFLSKN